ncbi:MAG: endonuclease MutS2 [Dehalococcoidales bacterium]|nr:endonuclease MutS2 [Dehalococcoidales bacterium]
MDDKSLEMLEFPQVREILSGFTSFSASKQLVYGLKPLSNLERISLLLRQSAEARRLLSEQNFSIGGVYDIRETVGLAARGKVLDPANLLQVLQTITATDQIRSSLKRLSGDFPLLWDIASGITELHELEKSISRCLAPTGELLDSASPKLASVRQKLRRTREELTQRLQAIMKSSRGQKIVQEEIITEREGRYVIPVKVESRREIKGIVHDVSNTGVTVFVEPMVTMELGNELRELVNEEKREIEKILRDLSTEVGSHETEIARNVARAAELDVALAKARYALKAKASEPAITDFNDGQGIIRLVEARHPLLGENAVPLSVEIGRDYSVLVITGPNTGGKTVALKTIGLLSLMAQAGIPVPASPETSLPVFDGIFADIGDEQSIEQTLSTFSWHVSNIRRIINNATEKSLVLLDELGTSTDPAEGSALARAILRYFLSRRTNVVTTTHFDELKVFAHATPGLKNASLDFDPVTLNPTYHLTVGIPGGSNALATASRLGLPAEIIDDARGMLTKGTQELETMLAGLMDEKQKLAAARSTLQREKAELERRNTEVESELERLKTEGRKAVQETRDRIVQEAADLLKEIRQSASDLRKEKSRERIEQARKAVAAAQEQLKSEVWQAEQEKETSERIAAGDTVRLKEADLQATVLSVSEEIQEIEVQAGHSRLRLSLSSVEKVQQGGKAPPITPVRKELPKRVVSFELDLRGRRADEVEPMLDAYLSDAVVANLSEVRIIHGMATGTVRRIVREFLAAHPLVKSFRSGGRGEGGDGVTMVRL